MRPLRRLLVTLTASLAVAATGAAFSPAAQAAPIDLDFANTTGSTFIAKQKVTAQIPTSSVKTSVDLETSTLTGSATIPDLTVKLNIAGLLGTTSTVRIVPVGGLTGTIDLGAGSLSTTTKFKLQLVKVASDLLPDVNLVSKSCISSKETTATLKNTTPLNIFDVTTVQGSYVIPPFTKCGLLGPVLNLLLAGPDNTLTLNLKA